MAEGLDDHRDADGRLDRAALLRVLPYGEAFLLIDEVEELTADTVRAVWRVPTDAPWTSAHFTDVSVVPGVLVGESLAQAGTLLVRHRTPDPEEKHVLGFQIDRALFSSPVLPGDEVRHEVRLENLRATAAKLSGTARVGSREVCRARLVVGIVDRRELREQVETIREERTSG